MAALAGEPAPAVEGRFSRARAEFEVQMQAPLLTPGVEFSSCAPGPSTDAMCLALTEQLTPRRTGLIPGGTVLVLAPRGAGKTTHVKVVCDRLRNDMLRGAVYVDFAIDTALTPRDVFLRRLGEGVRSVHDVLPEAELDDTRPVVLVCDNVDQAEDRDAMFGLLRSLAKLSIDSAAGQARFLVVALMDDPTMAQFLLNINGGEKVRMLAHGACLVGGDKVFDEASWQHRGMKWDEVSCRQMIAETLKVELTPAQEDRLVALSVQCGKPGFIRDFAAVCHRPEDVDDCLRRAQDDAAAGEEEWRACAAVSNLPMNPSDLDGFTWRAFYSGAWEAAHRKWGRTRGYAEV